MCYCMVMCDAACYSEGVVGTVWYSEGAVGAVRCGVRCSFVFVE